MKEYLPMRSPPSTLSKRNAPPSARSFANAETGVSRSASRSRTTGTSVRVFILVVSTIATSCLLPEENKNPRPITGRGLVVPPDLGPPSLADPQPPLSRSALLTVGFRASLVRPSLRDTVSRDPFAPLSPSRAHTSPRFSCRHPRPNRSRSSDVPRNPSTVQSQGLALRPLTCAGGATRFRNPSPLD